MGTYLVLSNLNHNGDILFAGSTFRQDRFTGETLERLISLGLVVRLPDAEPDAPNKSPNAAEEKLT